MTITEAIAQLEQIRSEHSDIPVGWDDDGLIIFECAKFVVLEGKIIQDPRHPRVDKGVVIWS